MKLSVLLLMAVFLGAVAAGAGGQAAGPADEALLAQAARDLERENYDEALAALTRVWEQGPRTPEKAFLLGRAYRGLLDYPKAREYLSEALSLKPKFPRAQLLLADTLVALNRLGEAEPLLQALQAAGAEPGQTSLLLGLVKAREGNYRAALDEFRRAQADPKAAQAAGYQASLALAALNRPGEARQALKEAISLDTSTPTADFAQRYLGLLEQRREVRPFRASASVGFDFDSNVTLQPGGAAAAQQVSGKGDVVYTQTATLEYLVNGGRPFNVLAGYVYYQNFHPRLTNYDAVSHTASLAPAYRAGNSRWLVPLSFTYMDVQSDKYYVGYLAAPTWHYLWTPDVVLEARGKVEKKYYWPVGVPPGTFTLPQDDRTALSPGGSLGLYYFFREQQGSLQVRVSYEHDFAAGSNWDSSGYRLLLSALYPLTPRLKVNAFVDLLLQPFDHRYFDGIPWHHRPQREDKVLICGAQATYNLWRGLDFNVHYYYARDDSNIPLYNYFRHIVGCQLGYRY
jgi:tetratricopeptide (TPR) repeat protein